MANLPEPDWITLSESARRAKQAFDVEQSAVEAALVAAFHDRQIYTRGRCRSYFKHNMLLELPKYLWDRAHVVWKDNKFVTRRDRDEFDDEIFIFEDVAVCREGLEGWINSAMPESQRGLQEADARPNQHQKKAVKPRGRGGRKPGSGAYTAKDRVLWKEMKSVMDRGKATTIWDAAGQFAEKAPGATFDSKRRRLAKGYNVWITTQ